LGTQTNSMNNSNLLVLRIILFRGTRHRVAPTPLSPIFSSFPLNKEDIFALVFLLRFPSSFLSPKSFKYLIIARSCPRTILSSKWILTFFPFNSTKNYTEPSCPDPNFSHFLSYLTNLLGSTNSDRNTLHRKPLSTSVVKDLILLFATTIKICTKRFSNLIHIISSTKRSRPSTFNL